jgi:hypothetical protein
MHPCPINRALVEEMTGDVRLLVTLGRPGRRRIIVAYYQVILCTPGSIEALRSLQGAFDTLAVLYHWRAAGGVRAMLKTFPSEDTCGLPPFDTHT